MVDPRSDRDTTKPTQQCSPGNNATGGTSHSQTPWATGPALLGAGTPFSPTSQSNHWDASYNDSDSIPRTLIAGFDHEGDLSRGNPSKQDGADNLGGDHHQDAASTQPFPTLELQTDFRSLLSSSSMDGSGSENNLRQSISTNSLPRRTASIRAALAATLSSTGSVSPGSVIPSPQLAAMADITPLPSPIQRASSSWRIGRTPSQSLSRASSTTSRSGSSLNLRSGEHSQPSKPPPYRSTPSQEVEPTSDGSDTQNTYLSAPNERTHTRHRSLSEYVPDTLPASQKRQNSVSGSERPKSSAASQGANIHRERYLAVQRGIAIPASRPPTPPRSVHSGYESGSSPNDAAARVSGDSKQIFSVRSIRSNQPRQYRLLRQLGQGTFSQVVLAVRQELSQQDDRSMSDGYGLGPVVQKLVAVKIVQYGPAGGADQERLEVSLKREVDILRSVNHPSLVQLKAFGSDEKRALLVLDYCPGGDLFEFASHGTKPLGPGLIRRIFSELVSAVRYLHENLIVHRDIKLENVLLNTKLTMGERSDWTTYERAVITLTDLGLSRRLPPPPESPILHTRCGSVDYAAPEILMGQGYDGRSTDAWALGVLLYAIMEQRLPFDPLPGARGDPAKLRQRTPHRIARCEWAWYRLADDQGEFDPVKGAGLEGARNCVEGLLLRSTKRKTLDEISEFEWVRDAIAVPSGLQRGDKEVP